MRLPSGTWLGRYEIVAPLGAGGMGEVYRATDRTLTRDVAIKVLPESVALDAERLDRFTREAKSVAALSHPNILSIFDFGIDAGVAYAVTELLEGETLRDVLNAGAVAPARATAYALQLASGLAAAHDKGIVHRDLKPENLVVLGNGHLKILDFGLAKRIEATALDGQTRERTGTAHTEPGTVMGTVGYMSPEQVRGLAIDHRTDIFSFGIILHELLAGRRPFKRDTAVETMTAILNEEPPDLLQASPGVSPVLNRIVRHCLEKDRDNRFHSAHDIAFALSEQSTPAGVAVQPTPPGSAQKRVLTIGGILLLAAAGALFVQWNRDGGGAAGVTRVAVLPFENLGAPEDDYFADGIADAVRGKLTSLPGVEVIARGSSTPYKKTTKTQGQIARELQARYLLTATVRWQKSGGTNRVQVSPELVEVGASATPTSRWQQPFDAALTDVFQVQSDIAARVAHALGIALGAGDEKRLMEKPTRNLAAYDAFLKGEEVSGGLAGGPALARKALGFYERAVALDPGFAEAWAKVAEANSLLYFFSGATPELARDAAHAADKATTLAPNRADGYRALGTHQRLVVGDNVRALEEYTRGRRVAPADPDLLSGTALAEMALGHWDTAIEHLRQAERLDPRSVRHPQTLARAFLSLRRHTEAREACDRGLALAPGNLLLIHYKVTSILGEGDLRHARAVLKDAFTQVDPTELVAYMAIYNDLVWVLDEQEREMLLRLPPSAFDDNKSVWGLCLAQASALNGDAASVRRYADIAREASAQQLLATPDDFQILAERGLSLAYLGRKQEAIREGERAVALKPASRNALDGPYFQHQLARIYILSGDSDKALDQLEPLLTMPYILSPAWLTIDPTFDSLRDNSRFQKLVAGVK